MPTPTPTHPAARAYADGVRALMAGPAVAAERGGAAPAAYEDLAAQAETLAPLSAELTGAVAGDLAAPEIAARTEAAQRLLAKALADLEVTAYLGQAALDELDGLAAPAAPAAERGLASTGIEEALGILLGTSAAAAGAAMRGGPGSADPATARAQLVTGAGDTLGLITERATRAGQTALTGILSVGLTELASAAAVVGTDLANLVGQGAAATKLVQGASAFAAQAGNSVTALLGPALAQTATQQVLSWADEVRSGGKFAEILSKAYDTPATLAEVQRLAGAAADDADRFGAAIVAVEALDEAYAAQVALAEKILGKARFLTLIPLGAMPQGRVLLAAIYLGLSGYVILCGADYADSPRLALLKRVPGVSGVVATSLSGA